MTRAGIIAVNLRDGDKMVNVRWTTGEDHLLLGTASGMAIRFDENDARVMGRNASGVKGIDLSKGDRVVAMTRCTAEDVRDLLTVTENGYGKRTPLNEYLVRSEDGSTRPQGRGGKGRRDIVTNGRNGNVVTVRSIEPGDDLILISVSGMIVRINAETVRQDRPGCSGRACGST